MKRNIAPRDHNRAHRLHIHRQHIVDRTPPPHHLRAIVRTRKLRGLLAAISGIACAMVKVWIRN